MVNILLRLALFAASCWLPGLSLSSALAQVTQASPVVATVATRPVELRGLRQTFRRGQPMGKYKQGVFCGPFGGKLEWDTSWNWNRRFNSEDFYRLFHEEVQAAGFRIAGLRTGFFDQGDGVRAEHMVAGTIDGLNLNLCYPYRQLGNIDSVQGNGTVHVSWEIFSKAENKVVATLQTEGSGRQSDYVSSGDYEIILAGFRDSVRKLVASPEFKAAFVGEPTKPSFTAAPVADNAILTLPAPVKSAATMAEAVAATVMVFADEGFGSGFLISGDGYVLTNHHVVDQAKYVKLRWSDGSESLGEVLRADKRRDVALIRTDAKGHVPLRVRTAALSIGDDVFAIGAPLDPQLQSTVTKGIVSAVERIFETQRYIQSDVAVNPGNSGGPLLDKQAQLVGLTNLGLASSGVPVGLNLFIPIGDALTTLGIRLSAGK